MSTTSAQLSSRNPFRTPAVTPNPTGTSASSSTALPPYSSNAAGSSISSPPSYTSAPAGDPGSDDEESPEALPELTPRIPWRGDSQIRLSPSAPPSLPPRPSSYSSATDTPPASRTPTIDDPIPETAPPAYSLSPDVGGGELLVQQGPRRPFQRAPEPFLAFPTPQTQQQERPGRPLQPPQPQPQPSRLAPPPGPPPGSSPGPGRPLSQMSDFAREFYGAGTATPPPSVTQQQQQQPQQTRYAPPPGPPPPRRRAASTSSGAGSTAPPASDGRPTTTPTPGHPLLRNGQTLVYPESYLCSKCMPFTRPSCRAAPRSLTCSIPNAREKGQNTGYKNFDPSHPCRKCWDRFGKPFTSILASSPWSDRGDSGSASQRGRSFQRPLPAFRPPQVSSPLSPPPPPPGMCLPSPGPSGSGLQRTSTLARALPYGSAPPSGATVVMPGDPRIGGRLCWQCGGRGTTPFLIFDELPCETCGGIGRLLN
ncbi:hypothetical protein BJV74DRAFT_870537 [Russula compacta]|nr:hypothetical protein BJV74DRAFT_870537 [Russula compacta]